MSMKWWVARPGPRQKQRESQAEKFFLSDAGIDRAEDLVREGVQNSMDAVDTPGSQVRVRIAFGTLEAASAKRYIFGLEPHIDVLRPLIHRMPDFAKSCPYLVFEDFGTTGLTRDPTQERRYDSDPANHFHAFYRAEGKTDKVGASWEAMVLAKSLSLPPATPGSSWD